MSHEELGHTTSAVLVLLCGVRRVLEHCRAARTAGARRPPRASSVVVALLDRIWPGSCGLPDRAAASGTVRRGRARSIAIGRSFESLVDGRVRLATAPVSHRARRGTDRRPDGTDLDVARRRQLSAPSGSDGLGTLVSDQRVRRRARLARLCVASIATDALCDGEQRAPGDRLGGLASARVLLYPQLHRHGSAHPAGIPFSGCWLERSS